MTTRLDLRASLRQRLEDLSASPLWDATTLNAAITAAMHRYGSSVPAERTLSLTISAGASSVALPSGVEGDRIRVVTDPDGTVVPRQRLAPGEADAAGGAQSWRSWGGLLSFSRPAQEGSWRIEYHASRPAPADDVTALDISPGDEEILLAMATSQALEHRIISEGKRGQAPSAIVNAAATAEREASWLLARRRRTVRSRWLA
jgi:hypothetical protein